MNRLTFCGFVAIIGRPNVGKSTILNRILRQKISITAGKPHTTRHQIIGVQTDNDVQMIFVDTPGLRSTTKKALHRYMNNAAFSALHDVDVAIMVVDTLQWNNEDEKLARQLAALPCKKFLLLNKVDLLPDKTKLLEHLQQLQDKRIFDELFPVSAKKGSNISELLGQIRQLMPEGPFHFPAGQVTNRSEQFLVTEIIREKLVRFLGEELPHTTTVGIEKYSMTQKNSKDILQINAVIYVERDGQKAIVIGKGGERIKTMGTEARKDIERMLAQKVYLELWVKVKADWTDNVSDLRRFGYFDD